MQCFLIRKHTVRNATDPISSSHLCYDLNGSRIEVASISTHHHSGALPVPQVDGGEDALNEVVQVVLLRLENMGLLPQAVGSRPLVGVRRSRQSQHLQGTIVHCSSPLRKNEGEAVRSSQRRERERERVTGKSLVPL